MQLRRNSRVVTLRDRKFMPLRVLGIFSFLLFVCLILLCAHFFYTSIYRGKNDIQKLLELESLGLPHTIQFERLERAEAAWDTKRGTALPSNLRNPFTEGRATTTAL